MAIFFSVLMGFLARNFGVYGVSVAIKISLALAFTTLIVATVLGYISMVGTIINGIAQTVPEVVNGVWGWVMPTNANLCLTVIGSVYLMRFFVSQYYLLLNTRFRAAVGG